ncbi:MAG: hypothetical protein L3K09_01170 [Thermoplasmata archaeon]|nr:hypothetical protein [Thermoplasmata archaeon]
MSGESAFDLATLSEKAAQRQAPARGRLAVALVLILVIALVIAEYFAVVTLILVIVAGMFGVVGGLSLRRAPRGLRLDDSGATFVYTSGASRRFLWKDPKLRLAANDRRALVAAGAAQAPEISTEGDTRVYRYPNGGVVRISADRVVATRPDGVRRQFSGFMFRLSRATVESLVGMTEGDLSIAVRVAPLHDAYLTPEAYDALRRAARKAGLESRPLVGRPPRGFVDGEVRVISAE